MQHTWLTQTTGVEVSEILAEHPKMLYLVLLTFFWAESRKKSGGRVCVCVQYILTVAPQGETGIIAGLVGIVNTC